jgi:COP9 signalosome complex subunit 1
LLLKGPLTTNHAILEIARTALIRAIPHIKETWDHRLYLECVNQIKRTLGKPVRDIGGPAGNSDDEGEGQEDEPMASEGEEGDGVIDSAWVKRVKEEEKREVTKMDVDLRGYMSNLIKESIRVS